MLAAFEPTPSAGSLPVPDQSDTGIASRRRKARNARKPSFSLVIAFAFRRPRTALLLWRRSSTPPPPAPACALPRKGASAPTGAVNRFDDSRHLRRTLAPDGSRSSGARVSSERHRRRLGRSLLARRSSTRWPREDAFCSRAATVSQVSRRRVWRRLCSARSSSKGVSACRERTQRGLAAWLRRIHRSVDRKRPRYFRERGEVRRVGISGLQLRREGRGRRRATRARRFGVLRCLDVRACDFHRACASAGRGARARSLRRSRRG